MATPADCPVGQIVLPGASFCGPVGTPCSADPWDTEAAAAFDAIFVDAGHPGDGDGTRAAPFVSIREAMAAAPPGAVIALARGRYREAVIIDRGVTLWGGCAAETVIEAPDESMEAATVTFAGDGGLRGVQVTGPRPGVIIPSGARAELGGVAIAGAKYAGMRVDGGELDASGLVISDTVAPSSEGPHGLGLGVNAGSRVSLRGAVLIRNRMAAIWAREADVALEDVALVGTLMQRNGAEEAGAGLAFIGGVTATLRRVVLIDNRVVALAAFDDGTTLEVTDLVVTGTAPDSNGRYGWGVDVAFGARAHLDRLRIESNTEIGLKASTRSVVTVADAMVLGTRAGQEGRFGHGIAVQGGATATINRALLGGGEGVGLIAYDAATHVTVEDVRIVAGTGTARGGIEGTGMHAQGGANIEGRSVAIADRLGAGISAVQPGTRIALSQVSIRNVLPRRCATSTCGGDALGDGIQAVLGAAIALEDFEILHSARVGVVVGGGEVDLRRGEVAHHPIGANIQTTGFDVARISREVEYRSNGRNLDRGGLPLPQPQSELP